MKQNSYAARRVWAVVDPVNMDEAVYKSFVNLLDKISKVIGSTPMYAGTPIPHGFFNMGANGKLFVVGHGDGTTIEGLTPNQLAHELVNNGGLQTGSTVRLVSCYSALSKWVFWTSSYAKRLKRELHSLHCDCTVVGQEGYATVTKQGSVRSEQVLEWKLDPKGTGHQVPARAKVFQKGRGKRSY